MRRGVGIGGLQKQAAARDTFKEAGQAMASAQIEQLKSQMEIFKKSLEEFAHKHQKDIKKNPLLRGHFQKMCSAIGVDPLVSSKGFWADMLGVGDFYYELGIQIVESCLVLQEQTGGLTDIDIVKRRIGKSRTRATAEISDDDIHRAVGTLKPLGSGYAVVDLGKKKAIQSVPLELSPDGTKLLALGENVGWVNFETVKILCWQMERFERAINSLVTDGLAWVDSQGSEATQPHHYCYWFPCFFKGFE